MSSWIDNLELEGESVRLILLQANQDEALLKAASDGRLWELWYTSVPNEKTVASYMEHALNQKQKGIEYPFAVVDTKSGEIIGSTRYYNLQPNIRRLEIGYTWYAASYQRTSINTEAKYLMLQYAFETLDCIAVQFMTHWHNMRSRKAIAYRPKKCV